MPYEHYRVSIDRDDVKQLLKLCGRGLDYPADNVTALLEHLARAAADGVRRPGAWERDWIVQATGVEL